MKVQYKQIELIQIHNTSHLICAQKSINLIMRLSYLSLIILLIGCSQVPSDNQEEDKLRSPFESIASMQMDPTLEVSLFAHEPMLVNPTNMDIDHLGRIWVCEGHNYRLALNPDKHKIEGGDRILILEDTDHDGKADKETVFYQGNDVNAALGISVLGNKVIVSKSPNIIVFTDTDGDDRPDSKQVLFTGMDAEEHDHGIHAVVFGPDGKLYFNAGNEIHQMQTADGLPAIDLAGNAVNDSGNPYRQGMVFRCNLDGSELETLGWNFRNPYELAVDPYGNIWQSDNDDDGNRGTRLNLVMEYGNYGFTDEMTGAGWRTKRTGWSEEIPLRHWHLNDPGVVPNLLQLYAGSPTGILFYEGDLLPEVYRQGLIHSEAGANVIRAYNIEKSGYGYKSGIEELMESQDPWFRPSDVCAAPDGSIFIADWYDPGVGGHMVGDQARGRIFRIAPVDNTYSVPTHDFETIPGLIKGLNSPNQAVRYLAWTGLKAQGDQARDALIGLIEGKHPSARALWLLAELDPIAAVKMGNTLTEDLRVTAIKIARQKLSENLLDHLMEFAESTSPQVQRELAIALRFQKEADAAELWAKLATKYQGDRWYLEALGIGSDLNADACFQAWLKKVGNQWNQGPNKDIVWRVRSVHALPLLARLIQETNSIEETYRYYRAFDFHSSAKKSATIASLLNKVTQDRKEHLELAFRHLDPSFVLNSADLKKQLLSVIDSYRGTEDFLITIKKYQLKQFNDELLEMVINSNQGRTAITRYLLENQEELLIQVLKGTDEQMTSSVIAALGGVGSRRSLELLGDFMINKEKPLPLRQQAARYYAVSWNGQNQMIEMLESGSLSSELVQSAAGSLADSWRPAIRTAAAKYLDQGQDENTESLPPLSELVQLSGNPQSGAPVFEKLCSSCHQIEGVGVDFGPGLSEIGSKLSKEALYTSILLPDAGISFGYEGYLITLDDGSKISGLIQSRTSTELTVKQLGGEDIKLNNHQITSVEQLPNSLMTPNLHKLMSQQELVDLISFLTQLKSAS